jgi:hypothetical protein
MLLGIISFDILKIKRWYIKMEEIILEQLGFKQEEIEAIENHFLCNLDLDDWESMEFIDDDEEEDENYFKLPTGRMIYFPDKLLHKELLAQID